MNAKKKFFILILILMFVSGAVYSVPAEKSVKKTQIVNINTASAKVLTSLPRIGEKVAQRIIEYRKKNGKFRRKEGIMKVRGIGEKLFARLKNRITV